MRKLVVLVVLLLNAQMFVESFAQQMPLVYDVENTGVNCPIPYLPTLSELPSFPALPDPFAWADGRGRMSNYSDWRLRRAEIGAQIQNYEIGQKPPRPDTITASYSGGVLTVIVTVNGRTLTLSCAVVLPAGTGPFPAVIGMNSPSGSIPSTVFSSRNIAQITFSHNQVTTYGSPNNTNPYYQLYPYLNVDNTGQYSAWAWGVSRIIDGLELVQNVLPIDLKHIAVTGCSYAGKMALFAGAFDERVALTIAQESGGGGATSWRYSQSEPSGTVEKIDNTDYNWFMNSMGQFAGAEVSKLPEDHHELMAMCAPRALLVTGNPDYTWLSNPSCYVCSKACQPVYDALGISDRFGFSIVGGHMHCQVPSSQIPEIGAFVDKFLLGIDSVNTNVADTPYSTDLSPWITWTNPALANDTTLFTTLVSPPNKQVGLDTTVTFKWNKANGAEEYSLQLSKDPLFANIVTSDSTTDTVKTITGLVVGEKYYWRVQVKSRSGFGPWSTTWQLTTIPFPTKPKLLGFAPDSGQSTLYTLRFYWTKAQYADQYLLQTSRDSTFAPTYTSATTQDTTKTLAGFPADRIFYWRVAASNASGYGPWSDFSTFPTSPSTGVKEQAGLPTEYSLSQNYPNPFNPTTRIEFALPQSAQTRIAVYDLLGRKVRTLINSRLEAGYHQVTFDAANLQSGVYFYRIQAGNYIATKKLLLLK